LIFPGVRYAESFAAAIKRWKRSVCFGMQGFLSR
jgi:hypothetical protein